MVRGREAWISAEGWGEQCGQRFEVQHGYEEGSARMRCLRPVATSATQEI